VALVHGSEGNITRIDEERAAAYREGYGSRDVARDRPSIAVFRGSRNGSVDRSSVLIEIPTHYVTSKEGPRTLNLPWMEQ